MHGSTSAIRSSQQDDIVFRPNAGQLNEVVNDVQTGRTMPQLKALDMSGGVHSSPQGPNIVIVHGCSTYINQNSNISFAQTFDMVNAVMDRCYAGFGKIVWSVNSRTKEHLSTHMQDVDDQLAQGQTINQAVQHANSTHPAAASGGSPDLPMQLRGDISARLVHAYTGNDATPLTLWYVLGGS